MSDAEKIVAGRLLKMASETYSNHGCNDMDISVFEGISVQSREIMAADFNQWNSHGGDPIPFTHIGDSSWMGYFAAMLGGDA